MSIRVHIDGEKYQDVAGGLIKELLPPVKAVVGTAADMVVTRAKQLLATPYQGAAAAEGEPPRKRKGDLLAAVSRSPVRVAGLTVSSTVTVADEGANGLEFGFVDGKGRHHLAHPFMRPALEEVGPQIEEMFQALEGLA